MIVNVELPQQEPGGPPCILNMEDTKDSLIVSFEITIPSSQALYVADLFGQHFPRSSPGMIWPCRLVSDNVVTHSQASHLLLESQSPAPVHISAPLGNSPFSRSGLGSAVCHYVSNLLIVGQPSDRSGVPKVSHREPGFGRCHGGLVGDVLDPRRVVGSGEAGKS